MRNLVFLFVIMLLSACNGRNINSMKYERIQYKDLPEEIIHCINNPNDFIVERNSMLIELPKGKPFDYKVESVRTWLGPWVSHVKLINIKRKVAYKIDRGVPYPFIIFESKLYIPSKFNMFTNLEDSISIEFTRYNLN